MIRVLGVNLMLVLVCMLNAAEMYDLDAEIARVKKELGKVEGERIKVKKEFLKDRSEFASYQERASKRNLSLKTGTDSLRLQIRAASVLNDSLQSELMSINTKIRQQDLNQKRLRETILDVCCGLQKEADSLPPLASEQVRGSLGYLSGEISAASIDNIEALNRLIQISKGIQSMSREVQSVEGLSPVGQLKGTVYRLRIGTVLEAAVDSKGEQAFFWDRAGGWQAAGDPSLAPSLLKAIKIREGKTVPSLVQIPFVQGEPEGTDAK